MLTNAEGPAATFLSLDRHGAVHMLFFFTSDPPAFAEALDNPILARFPGFVEKSRPQNVKRILEKCQHRLPELQLP